MYFYFMLDFYLSDSFSIIYLYLNCLSYASYYNIFEIPAQTTV